jgi:hypothetical protein
MVDAMNTASVDAPSLAARVEKWQGCQLIGNSKGCSYMAEKLAPA